MSNKQLDIKLKPSKYYLILSTTIHSICLLVLWLRVDYIVINLIVSALIIISFIDFVTRHILIKKANSIKTITITKNTGSFTTKNNKIHIDNKYRVSYKSNFLIIILMQKRYIVIFKDAIINKNISDINKLININ